MTFNDTVYSSLKLYGLADLFSYACYMGAMVFFIVALLNATECVKSRKNTMTWNKDEIQNGMIALFCGSSLAIIPTLLKLLQSLSQ